MASYKEAGKAQLALYDYLKKTFNSVAHSPVSIVSVWYAKENQSVLELDFVVTAKLKRQPTPEEAALLPKESLGVNVRYQYSNTPPAGL